MRYQATSYKVIKKGNRTSSFTLVELLIVIGILAILTAAIVILLNPSELLKQSRDSQRIQELSSLESSVPVLLTQNPSVSLGTASSVYVSVPDTSPTCANLGLPTLPVGYVYACATQANYRKTDGSGWLPVNFQSTNISSLQTLPVDPVNATSSGLFYSYMPGVKFRVQTMLESNKYLTVARSLDLLVNGGFETGANTDGWINNLTRATLVFNDAEPGKSGLYNLKSTAVTVPSAGIYKTTLELGKRYFIKFKYKVSAGTLLRLGDFHALPQDLSATSWTNFSQQFTARSMVMSFYTNTAGGIFFIDDLILEEL
jgi:hypothetical protein